MKKIGTKCFLAAILDMLAVNLGGCMSKNNKLISYMEERYGKTFTYIGETNGTFGSKAFTARLSCPDDPEAEILASWLERDGTEYYADNYMAVRYHEEAYEKLEEAVGRVFSEYRLIFATPDVLLTIEDPGAYSLEDYMDDPLACKTVYIITQEELDEEVFQALAGSFTDSGISVKGLAAQAPEGEETAGITEDNVDEFLAGKDRVCAQVNFRLEHGTLISENWR